MSDLSIEERIRLLPDIELTVLFLKCQPKPLTYVQMYPYFQRGERTVQKYAASMYNILGIAHEDNPRENERILAKDFCPILFHFGETIEKIKDNLHPRPSDPNIDIDYTSPGWMIVQQELAIEAKQKQELTTSSELKKSNESQAESPVSSNPSREEEISAQWTEAPRQLPPPPPPPPVIPWWLLVIVFGCVGLTAFWLGRISKTPNMYVITATMAPTLHQASTATALIAVTTATATPAATPTQTATPAPTNTLPPTDTPTPSILGVGSEIADNRVSLRMTEKKISMPVGLISRSIWAIGYKFHFQNNTQDQLVLKFDKYEFVTHDNLNQAYDCTIFDGFTGEFDHVDRTLNPADVYDFYIICGQHKTFDNPVTEAVLSVGPISTLNPTEWHIPVQH